MGAKDEQQIPSEETMMREQSPLVDEEFEEAISEVPLGQESSADYELAASDEQQLGAATSQMDRQLEEEGFSFANRSEMQEVCCSFAEPYVSTTNLFLLYSIAYILT